MGSGIVVKQQLVWVPIGPKFFETAESPLPTMWCGAHSLVETDRGRFIFDLTWHVRHTQQTFIMFINVLGQHVSILIESSSGPSKKIDPYLEMHFKHF